MKKQELEERFAELCERMGGSRQKGEFWFREMLWYCYQYPDRSYHTLTHHISHALELLDAMGRIPHRDEIEFALWFHDIIYDGQRHDNEERSAGCARAAAGNIGIRGGVRTRALITVLIEATIHDCKPPKGPWLHERQVMADIDLQGLGGTRKTFNANGRRIRKEYAFATPSQYAAGRTAFAKKMLARPSVFSTPEYKRRFERRAQANLRSLL